MAVVGSAEIIVNAVTKDFKRQVEKGFKDAAPSAEKEGQKTGRSFNKGFSRGLGDALKGFDRFIPQDFADRAERARLVFRNLNRAFTLIFPVIIGVGGAIGALGGGLITLVATVGNAARSVGIVLVGALGALGQAAIATSIAFKGVGDAISAGLQAQAGGAAAARNEEAALRRLRDARLALRNLIEKEKPEALAQAREEAARAAETAADAVLNAERAERSYFDAQKATLEAQEDLNDAREEAKERLQQLRFEVEGAAISEKRARIEFERARESLQRVQDLPPNSRARQEAELAFAEADLNLRKAIDRNADLKKEENAATKAGVEGSDLVRGAKERLANAQQAETDAGLNAARAFRDAARAQQEAAQLAADASAGGRVEQELDARIARAREAVKDAEAALGDAAAGGVNKFQEALDKLSPSAREFVQTIIDNEEAFTEFKKTVQEPFFQEFNSSLDLLISRLPELGDLFAGTSRITGRLATGFVDLFLGAENFDRTQRIWKTNDKLIENLGNTFLNLTDGLLLLLDAAEPVILAFGEWAEQTSAGWVADLKSDFDGVRDSIQQSADKAARIFGILGTIGDIFGVIGEEINESGGAADIFLGWLEEITDSGLKDLQTAADDGSLKQFFIDVTENAILVLEVIGNIIQGLLILGAQPGTGQFLTSLKESTGGLDDFAREFGAEDGPLAAIGEFIKEFFGTFSALLQNESFTTFIETLTFGLIKVQEFLKENEKFFEAIAPILGYALAFGFIGTIIKNVFEVLAGYAIFSATVFQGQGTLIGDLVTKAGGFAGIWSKILNVFKVLLGPVGLVVAAIALMWENSQMFRDGVMGAFGALGDVFKMIWENNIKPVFGEIQEGLAPLFTFLGELGRVFGDILSFVIPVISLILGALAGLVGGLIEGFGGLVSVVANVIGGIVNIVRGIIGVFVGIFTGDFTMMEEAFAGLWENIKNIFKGIIRFILGGFRGLVNGFIAAWNGLADRLVFKLPEWLGGFEFQMPKVPLIPDLIANLAMGGVVPATPGGVMARIGEAGRPERVEPLDPDGLSKRDKAMITMLAGQGPTINVHPAPGMNEAELARRVSREMANQMRRGSV